MYWILAAIDGTNSQDWAKADGSNSFVKKFWMDFKTPDELKNYWNGPNETTFGGDSISILSKVSSWLTEMIDQCHNDWVKKSVSKWMTDHPAPNYWREGSNAFSEWEKKLYNAPVGNDDIRICLVGHSRGGLIAIKAAEQAKIIHRKIYFMGLYDAVDRQLSLDGSSISNVENVYHARRDIWRSISRPYFSNTGTKALGDHSRYNQDFFVTSHGGVGGDWGISGSQYLDLVLAIPFPIRLIDILNAKRSELLHKKPERLFEMESKNADQYIRMGARSAELPI